MLIIFGGLPGSGKTTIAKILSQKLSAAYLRIDSIEQALIKSGIKQQELYAHGYEVGYALAAENLQLNLNVIADSVNSLNITREAWRNVGFKAGAPFIEIELICSDRDEHRKRVESRSADILNLELPSWQNVLEREYDPWDQDHLIIDTAIISVNDAVDLIMSLISPMLK